MSVQRLAILGSTGSIGESTLDLVRRHPDRFIVDALVAGRQVGKLADQIREFRPKYVAVADARGAQHLREELGTLCEIDHGATAAIAVAQLASVDTVVAAIVGAAGLPPTYAAVRAGKRVCLANKESMVAAGPLMRAAVAESGAQLLPVDSEHCGVFMALMGHRMQDVTQVILTASGGPFRDRPSADFAQITVDDALKHPNWSMGAKITIDSATLMNKGLELIEARWLFDLAPEQLGVVVHRESIIHALVEYCDGTMVAQLASPDMRAPIAYALTWPERIDTGIARLSLAQCKQLTFAEPDRERFPCLRLAEAANVAAGTAPAILNAANEVAVEAFLNRRLHFTDIPRVIERVLDAMPGEPVQSIAHILTIDAQTRECTRRMLKDHYATV